MTVQLCRYEGGKVAHFMTIDEYLKRLTPICGNATDRKIHTCEPDEYAMCERCLVSSGEKGYAKILVEGHTADKLRAYNNSTNESLRRLAGQILDALVAIDDDPQLQQELLAKLGIVLPDGSARVVQP